MTTKTQCAAIWRHLRSGKTLTVLEAIRLCGAQRASARVKELRERGKPIRTHMVKIGGKRVARYFVPMGNRA